MIYSETKMARIHGVKFIRAVAKEIREAKVSWLEITTDTETEVTIFMPYKTALEYASAINGCNDKEKDVSSITADEDFPDWDEN